MANKPYFVYELIDPRTKTVFYVGKGVKDRPKAHLREAAKGKMTAKCQKIRDIVSAGLEVTVSIARRFDNERAAYAFERKRIEKYGLDNLTNMQPGGPSTWAAKADPDVPMLSVIALFIKKTNGMTSDRYRWWFGQKWHELPPTFIPSLRNRLAEIIQRRGVGWATKAMGRHGVALSVQPA